MSAGEQGQSADNPYPVRTVAMLVKGWIDKLGTVWVEGQIAQLTLRPNSSTAFITLRDPAADMSLSVTCPRDLVLNAPVKLSEGTRVIMLGKAELLRRPRDILVAGQPNPRGRVSASCWRVSSDCASCWTPKACSIRG